MDCHSKETRSYNMSHIRCKDTKPEIIVRQYLFSQKFRYRKNVKTLPGCPDIVLPKYRVVIFINGCFWHIHEGCSYFVWPKSNKEFWHEKLSKNQQRDKGNYEKLSAEGWRIIILWECELKRGVCEKRLNSLIEEISKEHGNIKNFLNN